MLRRQWARPIGVAFILVWTLLPLYCKKVMATNTTATAIVALF